jgi:outer membrane immunogenic protein
LGARPYAKAPAYYPPVYSWTGFYIGGHIGGAWTDRGSNFTSSGDGRFLGGLQGGADYQFAPNWVVGIEGQYSWLGSNTGFAFPGGVVTDNRNGIGSVTGRVGWTWGPGLVYVKGGYGFADNGNLAVTTTAGAALPYVVNRRRSDGATVGAGLEYMFAPNWSAKGEYQYYNFGSTTFLAGSPAALVGVRYRNDEHTFKAGVNYRFNWGAPASARY